MGGQEALSFGTKEKRVLQFALKIRGKKKANKKVLGETENTS